MGPTKRQHFGTRSASSISSCATLLAHSGARRKYFWVFFRRQSEKIGFNQNGSERIRPKNTKEQFGSSRLLPRPRGPPPCCTASESRRFIAEIGDDAAVPFPTLVRFKFRRGRVEPVHHTADFPVASAGHMGVITSFSAERAISALIGEGALESLGGSSRELVGSSRDWGGRQFAHQSSGSPRTGRGGLCPGGCPDDHRREKWPVQRRSALLITHPRRRRSVTRTGESVGSLRQTPFMTTRRFC